MRLQSLLYCNNIISILRLLLLLLTSFQLRVVFSILVITNTSKQYDALTQTKLQYDALTQTKLQYDALTQTKL